MRVGRLTPFHRFTAVMTVLVVLGVVFLPLCLWGPLLGIAAFVYVLVLAFGVARPGLAFFLPTIPCFPPGQRAIALTFDDGPDPRVTPAILRELARHGARATFFCVGQAAEAYPELVDDTLKAGHIIGNHTHRHGNTTNCMSARALRQDLMRTQSVIQRACGVAPQLFRSPMGLTNPRLGPVLRDMGLVYIAWSVRSFDRHPRNLERVIRRVTQKLRDGAIVLLHDGGVDPDQATALLRAVLDTARCQGLRCLTVQEMLESAPRQSALRGDVP